MNAKAFCRELRNDAKRRNDVAVESFPINHKHGVYELLRISSKTIMPIDKVILLRAGIHGDETAGPFTMLYHFHDIADYVHHHGLKLIAYPLSNPSGFEANLRYNIDNDNGVAGNNDFLWYRLRTGALIDDIGKSDNFVRWHWSSDKGLNIRLPRETALMHRLLKRDPIKQIVAAIDLHQDCWLQDAAAYHYAFGDFQRYKGIVRRIERLVPIVRNQRIDEGYKVRIDMHGGRMPKTGDEKAVKSNDSGFILRHDGSLSDLMCRLGAEHSIATETAAATPMEIACRVNLTWIFGVVDLVAERNPARYDVKNKPCGWENY